MTFTTLGLSEPLLRAVQATGYTSPTPIQAQAIPAILAGHDVMGAAQTGSGKTAGFTLPLLQLLDQKKQMKPGQVRALLLTPTRELAAQVQNSIMTYGKFVSLRTAVVFGGVNINPQKDKLRRGVDILVATPGRLLDLYRQNAVKFDAVEILVLDEADRMLDMGFMPDIKKIMALLPKQRQNLMFSATFSNTIRQLAKSITNNPVEIDVSPRNATVDTVIQKIHPVDKARKADLLGHLITSENWYQVLVFIRTKHGADKLVKQLVRNNIHAAAIHSNKSQAQRTKTLADFKRNKIQVLVGTDIASRGIDIIKLSHVVNFDMPNTPEDYVHRIGRTARAGAGGHAISLVSADEIKQVQDIERLINRKIDREEITDFEPRHAVPQSRDVKPARNNQKHNGANRKSNGAGGNNHKPGNRNRQQGRDGMRAF
jgi:ATP-dependent RNA helicase RhlE